MTTTNEQIGTKQSAVFPRACALALAALVAAGCGADAGDDLGSETLASDVPCGDPGAPPVTDPGMEPGDKGPPSPAGAYFAGVTANGTGCPVGTWTTELSDDGSRFITKFSAFEAQVNESTAVAIKDCQLALQLHSPKGLSFRVKKLGIQGTAYLEEGVSARITARHYFSGNPVAADQFREDLTGPFDDTLTFDAAAAGSGVWSPCGVDRDLNVSTTVRVLNGPLKKNGKVKIESVLDGEFEWRACDAGTTPPAAGEPEHTAPEVDEDVDGEAEVAAPEAEAAESDAGARRPRGPRSWWGGRRGH